MKSAFTHWAYLEAASEDSSMTVPSSQIDYFVLNHEEVSTPKVRIEKLKGLDKKYDKILYWASYKINT